MLKTGAIFLFFFINLNLFGQLVQEFDTLNFNERMNGSLDSIDIVGANLPTTFDGGRTVLSPKGLSVNQLFNHYTTPNFMAKQYWDKMSFSALPHLGFSYTFGSQTSQFLNARYEQSFSDSLILNIDYRRTSSLGTIRNAGFNTDNVAAQLQRLGKVYSFTLKGRFVSEKINHSGGITTDTLIQDFGLEFTPVLKSNAFSKNKQGIVDWHNYFDFNKDSIQAFGLVLKHDYTIKNRVYTEEDTISGLYPNVYIDSFSTRDQYNLASIRNGIGIFFMNKNVYADVLVDYNYWDYQNLGYHHYRYEFSLHSDVRYSMNKLIVKNKFYFNLAGAFNELSNKTSVQYSLNKFNFSGDLSFEKLAPTAFQRFYKSNNNLYSMTESNIKLQQWTKANVSAKYSPSSSINLRAFASYFSMSSVYLFNGTEWKMNNTQGAVASVGVESAMRFGVFNIQPRFIYSSDEQQFLPKIQASSRLFFKGKLFKAKKLEAALGVDVSYISSFTTRSYNSLLDSYDFYATGSQFTDMVNMHAFVNLGISEFRFFLRFENIGYFWSPKEQLVVNNYPIAGSRIRIGLTWDFFN